MLTFIYAYKTVLERYRKTSNHGYLFWGTEVGGNGVAVSTEVGGDFQLYSFYAN